MHVDLTLVVIARSAFEFKPHDFAVGGISLPHPCNFPPIGLRAPGGLTLGFGLLTKKFHACMLTKPHDFAIRGISPPVISPQLGGLMLGFASNF